MRLYDNDTYFQEDPKPALDERGILKAGQEMYKDMSPETGAFMDMMMDTDAFDVFTREGKWTGGYMTSFDKYHQPFIFANFNGTTADVDVVTHEAGHAFAYYMSEPVVPYELGLGAMETAETHSMSMEFFAWKYTDMFFGKDANKYRYKHLFDALTFIPYGTIVDYFQHIVYENPDMTPKERDDVWLKLEKEFRPWMDADDVPYLSKVQDGNTRITFLKARLLHRLLPCSDRRDRVSGRIAKGLRQGVQGVSCTCDARRLVRLHRSCSPCGAEISV